MAKGNPILGTMQGTIGDVTTYNYNGNQVTRVRRRTIRNPRTNKQAIQRTIASTVAKFVSAFAPVLNNSLQSEGSKVSTLAKIRSLNMNMLRQLAAKNLGVYAPKGTMYVAPNNYIISRGTLTGLEPLHTADALAYMSSHGAAVFSSSVLHADASDLKASEAFPTVAVGDQISILCSTTEDIAEGSLSVYCRFAFKDDTTPVYVIVGDNRKLNPAAIDLTKADGPWDKLIFNEVEIASGVDGVIIDCSNLLNGSQKLDSFGIIVSREDGKLRSTAHMVSNAAPEYALAKVYPTYMDGGTPIDIPSESYLNNDAHVI